MRILITGGTGLIGSHLIPKLFGQHQITALTRNVAMAEMILSHKIRLISKLDQLDSLDEFDVIINLAGEPIVNKRWSDHQKRVIEHSRWDITQALVDKIKASEQPPELLISGSAIGYYGRQGEQEIDESFDSPHDEFSHQLCKRWEDIALQAASDKTRVCILRTGVVLSRKGGALEKMLPPFKFGLGGPIGSGQQYMSWIHMQDMVDGILYLIAHDQCSGIYNFTAPQPVTNKDFASALGKQLGRPTLLTTPAFAMRLLMGEMADLLLTGQRVIPRHLEEDGFRFSYPTLDDALCQLDP